MNKNNVFLEVGQIIQNKRKELNISISFIAKKYSIRENYIEMLENGYIEEINHHSYYYGYLSILSRELNLNEEEILYKVGFFDNFLIKKQENLDLKQNLPDEYILNTDKNFNIYLFLQKSILQRKFLISLTVLIVSVIVFFYFI